jgi:hypothetical protein
MPCRNGNDMQRAASLSVKVTDRILRGRQTAIGSSVGARRMNAAVPIRSNLSRLEHKLQTVVDGDAGAAAISLKCRRLSATRLRRHSSPSVHAPHGKFRLPCSFEGISSLFGSRHWRHERRTDQKRGSKPAFACGPAVAGTIAADVPDALTGTQSEHFAVSHLFIRPQPRNWQAAYRICREGRASARFGFIVQAPPIWELKFRLTTPAYWSKTGAEG